MMSSVKCHALAIKFHHEDYKDALRYFEDGIGKFTSLKYNSEMVEKE